MRHHSVTTDTLADWRPVQEPEFDLPPRLAGRAERRLAQRAERSWAELSEAAGLPPSMLPGLDTLDQRTDSEFAANSLLIDLRHQSGEVFVSIGDAIAATFGSKPGAIRLAARPGSLVARLHDACDLLRLTLASVPVEGAVSSRDCACMLVRGVLMPIAGADGRLGYAHGVLSWKQVLDTATSAALRRELAAALRPPASTCAVDAFR